MHIGRLLDRKNIIGYFLINSAYLNKNNNFPFASSLYVTYITSWRHIFILYFCDDKKSFCLSRRHVKTKNIIFKQYILTAGN